MAGPAAPTSPDVWLEILTEDTCKPIGVDEQPSRSRFDKQPSGVQEQPPGGVDAKPRLNAQSEPQGSLKRGAPECPQERDLHLKRQASEAEFQRLLEMVE